MFARRPHAGRRAALTRRSSAAAAAEPATSFLNSASAAGDGTVIAVYDAAYSTLLDAPGGSAASDGGAVGSISDVSGNEGPCVQATVGARPTLDVDGFGGGPCLTFDGGDFLQLANFAGGAETQPNTLVVIFSLGSTATGQRILGSASVTERHEITCYTSPAEWGQYAGANRQSGIGTDTDPHCAIGVFNNPTSAFLTIDGVGGTTTSAGSQDMDGVCIGGGVGAVLVASGAKIAAAAVYAGDIGATARAYIWAQAQARWGLS